LNGIPEGTDDPAANLLQTNLLQTSLQAALAGAIGGALAAVVILGIQQAQGMIWGQAINEGLPTGASPVLSLGITISIGLVLALIQRHRSPALLPEINDTLRSLRGPEPQSDHNEGRKLLGGALALIGGGSLGPEALVTHLVVLVSRWIWRGKDRTVVAAAMAGSLGLFHSPLAGASALVDRRWQLIWRWLPGLIGGVAGFLSFNGLGALAGGLQGVPYHWPEVDQQTLPTVLGSLVGGVIGSGCGLALLGWRRWLQGLEPLRRFWPAPILTGLLLGLALWKLPLATFSGEHQLRPLLLGTWALTPGLAILSGVGKLLLVGLCLETGWRGGKFFPVIVGSCAIGLGLHQLVPQIGTLETWCGSVVGGCLGALMPSPLLALVLGITLLQGHGSGALVLGLLVSLWGLRLMRRRDASGRELRDDWS